MPQTLAEKIIAHAAGRATVRPGEIVTCRVDLALMHDSGGPRRIQPILAKLGAKVWDPNKVVIISDHYVPAVDADSAAILDLTRKWAAANGIAHFYDLQGICHVVLPERGHLRPGMFVVGGRNFGMGSSREQAPQALRHLGVSAVLAPSFGGIFYRNALNLGLLALVCPEAGKIAAGDQLALEPENGKVHNLTRNEVYACEPIPAHLTEMVRAGGLVPYLARGRAS